MKRSLHRLSRAGLRLIGALSCVSLLASAAHAEPPPEAAPRGVIRPGRATSYPLKRPHALSYDRARGRVVMHQQRLLAEGAEPVAETWELVGDSFELVSDKGPTLTDLSRMAYDEKRGVSVLFPAQGASGQPAAWEWDGVTWSERSLLSQPQTTGTLSWLYHRKLEKLFLCEHYYRRAWLYDQSGWSQVPSAEVLPLNISGVAAAYDDERDRIVFVGGVVDTQAFGGKEVWEWDTSEGWLKILPKGSRPGPRSGAQMVFDEVRREVLLQGGTPDLLAELGDTWSWDGKAWSQRTDEGPRSSYGAMVWDGARQRALTPGMTRNYLKDSFRYHAFEGDAWVSRPMSAQPEGRVAPVFVGDEVDGSLLLFGGLLRGSAQGTVATDTWRFRQGSWAPVAGAAPTAHEQLAWASLPGGGALVFGGKTATGVSGETWIFEQGAWRQLFPAASPPPRSQAALARQGDGSLLLFGGKNDQGLLGDTWRWDGQGWSAVEPAGPAPAPRAGAALARHAGRDQIYLFGGLSTVGLLSDTWSWDGQRWAELDTTSSPPASQPSGAIYEDALGAILVNAEGAMWALDGVTWTRLPLRGPEALAVGATLARDPAHGTSYAYGGDLLLNHEYDGVLRALSPLGQPCATAEACPSGSCVDGVCCSQAACGFCEACNVPGHEGSCTALAANEKDADSCASDQACDGKGGCKQALGEACSAASDCAGAFCAGGFCCLEKACDGVCSSCEGQAAGVCGVVVERPNPGKCDRSNRCDAAGLCRLDEEQPCTDAAVCASGRCEAGKCVGRDEKLCLPGDVALLLGGTQVPCSPYRCVEGACNQRCTSSDDCTDGARCDGSGRCTSADVVSTGEGCGAAPGPAGSGWLLGLCAVGLAARRRRRAALLGGALGLLAGASVAEAKPSMFTRVVAPWHLPPAGGLTARDAATGETLSFGGSSFYLSRAVDEFWSWDGATYRRLDGDGPGARAPRGFVHDRARDRFLLIGDSLDVHRDLWEWNRSTWRPVPMDFTPHRLPSNALLWDDKQQRVLLVHPASFAEKIFSFSEGHWEPVAGSEGGPSLAEDSVVGHDEGRGVVVVVAGGQLWEWDGAAWADRTPAPEAAGPLANNAMARAYDPTRQLLVFCSGIEPSGLISRACHGWDGQAWSPLPTLPDSLLQIPQLFHDARLGALVARVRNELDAEAKTALVLGEQGWQGRPPQPEPQPLFSAAGAHDPSSKETVFFGGATLAQLSSRTTWVHDGGTWSRLQPEPSPPPLVWSSMTFDPNLGGLLLVGGSFVGASGGEDEQWLFKGHAWTKLTPTLRPEPRYGEGMVTDLKRNRVLLFGGSSDGLAGDHNDTWSWDGQAWTELYPAKSPIPARKYALLVRDEARDRVVLFGGMAPGLKILDDTWEFDGETWERKTPAHSPPRQHLMSGYFDPQLGKTILLSGLPLSSGGPTSSSIWAWDGVDWEELSHEPRLGCGAQGVAVYDPVFRGGFLLPPFAADRIAFGEDVGVQGLRVVGNACASGETCSTGLCTDDVCCVEADCGPCRSCAVDGVEGTCAPLPRGTLDPRCAVGQACDAGRCVDLAGATCEQGSECLSGSCVDGVCCAQSACGPCASCALPGRKGECVPILGIEDPDSCSDGMRCDPVGRCRKDDAQPCTQGDECASGVCLDGGCKPTAPPYCDGDHTLYSAQGTFDCGAYRCDPEGACRTRCASTTDCASGHRCAAEGVCVVETVVTTEGSCALASPRARGPSALAWAGLGLVLLGCGRRRPR